MTSPSGPSRRRPRSSRVLASVALLLLAAALVTGAALSGLWPLLVVAAALAVALGAGACRLVYSDLTDVHRSTARERATLARDYQDLAACRAVEHREFVTAITRRLDDAESVLTEQHARILEQDATVGQQKARIADLRGSLSSARADLDRARARLASTTARAEQAERERAEVQRRLADADERAAEAIVRVVELEQELDVTLAQWQAGESHRKHA